MHGTLIKVEPTWPHELLNYRILRPEIKSVSFYFICWKLLASASLPFSTENTCITWQLYKRDNYNYFKITKPSVESWNGSAIAFPKPLEDWFAVRSTQTYFGWTSVFLPPGPTALPSLKDDSWMYYKVRLDSWKTEGMMQHKLSLVPCDTPAWGHQCGDSVQIKFIYRLTQHFLSLCLNFNTEHPTDWKRQSNNNHAGKSALWASDQCKQDSR